MRVLVTGAAGFIGFHTAKALLERGDEVIGIDNVNDYYDVSLKEARLNVLDGLPGFSFLRSDIADRSVMNDLFERHKPQRIVHLAAQAGVRYADTNPYSYVESNLAGFLNILEACRLNGIEHLVYASSSSVYGANTKLPFSVDDGVNHPVSLYAATKKSNELMAHAYAHLYRFPVSGLRFFTVYGPWGRPDMALFRFTKAILAGKPIDVYNQGRHARDFTYIDDIVTGVCRVLDKPAEPNADWSSDRPDPGSSSAPYRLYNIGNNQTVQLIDLIATLEATLGRTAEKNMLPLQPGDVVATYANVDALSAEFGFKPSTPIGEGVRRFVDWYRTYYGE